MSRILSTLTVLIAVALLAGAVGPAAAQVEVPGGIDTATSPEPSTEIVIDGETRVTDWRYEDGVFVLQIEAEDGKPITFMSVPSKRGSGGGQANVKRQYVARGNNTVRFRAQGSDPVVTMTTAQSIEEGRVAYVKATTGIDLFRGPATWGYVWAAGGISFLGGVGAVLYYAREFLLSDDPEVAERVL